MKIKEFDFPENNCVYQDAEFGVLLYHDDCIQFMSELTERYPEGVFDMIFAD